MLTLQLLYQKDAHGPFGLAIGGYSAGADVPEILIVRMNGSDCDAPEPLDCSRGTIFWEGQTEAISRIVLGVSSALPQALGKLGVPDDQAAAYAEQIGHMTSLPLVFPGMPVSEAIDLARFLVDATIKFVRFAPGHPTVGGPIEIVAITRHEGFKWIDRKHYYSQDLNVEETLP